MGKSRRRGARGKTPSPPPGPGTRPSQDQAPALRDRGVLIGGALVALAILAVYGNGLFGPFIFDDLRSICENPTIRRLWPIGSVLWPPAGSGGLRNRPVVNLSLAINYALGGEQVFGYHLFNVAVHIIAALTLLGVVRRTLRLPVFAQRFGASAAWYGTTVALLWGLHPLATEAVTYTIQRCESMCSMFYLLTLYCCIRGYGAASPRRWFGLAVASCFLGIACKETMVTAPVMVLLYDRVFVARSWKELFQRRWGLYAMLAGAWVFLGLLMAQYWGTQKSAVGFGWGMTGWEYARTQFWAICRYVRLAFWPSGLVIDYGDWIARAPGEIGPCAIVVAVLLLATVVAYRRWPWAGYLGTWFFVILAPTSSVVPLVTQTVAERRMYLPLAAVTTLVVFMGGAAGKLLLAWTAWPERLRRRAVMLATGLVACIAVALGCQTVLRNRDYRSVLALWDDLVRKRPDNPSAYLNRAAAYDEIGEWDKEIVDCNKAVELKANYAEAYVNRGNAYGAKGDNNQAIADYSKAIELKPGIAPAYNNRGSLYRRTGDNDRAIADFSKAIELKPNYLEAYNNRGDAYSAKGDNGRAIADFSRAIALKPGLAPAYNNRGLAYSRMGNNDRAIADFSKAIELKPDYAEAYVNRGNAYGAKGDSPRAVADYSKAIELKPDDAEAYTNRGAAYSDAGAYDRAIQDFTKAIALRPDLAEAYSNRADALNALGQYGQAVGDCDKALALNPRLAEAYYHRGNAHKGLGQNDQALADYSRLVQLKPRLAESYDTRGAMHFRVGAYDRAVQDHTKAIELRPNYAQPYINRALVYCALKDFPRAWADIKMAQNLGASPPPELVSLLTQAQAAPPKP